MPAPRHWTEETIIAAVIAFIHTHGHAPHREDFTPAQGLPSVSVVDRRMGTWQEPVRQAVAALEGTSWIP
jgi:hypothetical protein